MAILLPRADCQKTFAFDNLMKSWNKFRSLNVTQIDLHHSTPFTNDIDWIRLTQLVCIQIPRQGIPSNLSSEWMLWNTPFCEAVLLTV